MTQENSRNDGTIEMNDRIIHIDDPQIDVESIMRQIREDMVQRKAQGMALRTLVLSEDRLVLRAIHETLRVRVQAYGNLGDTGGGLIGRVRYFFRRLVFKAIRRHVDQERDVQESILCFIDRLTPYLDQAQYSEECLRRVENLEKRFSKMGL